MKKMRKGFTLIELLIVVVIVGVLSAMMAISSSESVDSAQASAILSNLQTMKTAAFQMYTLEPQIASMKEIKFGTNNRIVAAGSGVTDTRTIAGVLGSYMGKRKDALTSGGAAKKYGLVGNSTSWYVVYALDAEDSTGVKNKLAAKAKAADLYGWTSAEIPTDSTNTNTNLTTDQYEGEYYTVKEGDAEYKYIALKVR